MKLTRTLILASTLFGLTGHAAAEGDAEAGAKVFKKCMACHTVSGPNKVGPSLNNIVDRPVASVDGFKYSKAMKAAGEAGQVWDMASLKTYLANPRTAMKGNRMAFVGLKKEQEQDDVIAYIMSESK